MGSRLAIEIHLFEGDVSDLREANYIKSKGACDRLISAIKSRRVYHEGNTSSGAQASARRALLAGRSGNLHRRLEHRLGGEPKEIETVSNAMNVTPAPPTTLRATLTKAREFEADRDRFRAEAAKKEEEADTYLNEWTTERERREALEASTRAGDAAVAQAHARSARLQENLEAAKARREPLDPETGEAIIAYLVGRETPETVLQAAAAAYPDRLVVLTSAFSSARRASAFKNTAKLGLWLHLLATDYYDALVDGRGDAAGRAIFGDDFAASESTTTKGNHRARSDRTFPYKGEDLVMWRHLREGVKESVAETIRVHFAWVADEKKIVIGWCGEHLYRVE